jgi:hypothetical protein
LKILKIAETDCHTASNKSDLMSIITEIELIGVLGSNKVSKDTKNYIYDIAYDVAHTLSIFILKNSFNTFVLGSNIDVYQEIVNTLDVVMPKYRDEPEDYHQYEFSRDDMVNEINEVLEDFYDEFISDLIN